MNNYLIKLMMVAILLIATNIKTAFTQGCDPQLIGMSFSHMCVLTGGIVTMEVGWAMGGGDPTCNAPAESWRIQISLPASGEYTVTNISNITGPEFDWTLDGTTLNGLNNQAIPWLYEGTIEIPVEGIIGAEDCGGLPIVSQANIQIMPGPPLGNGSPGSFENLPGNDLVDASLSVDVLEPLPVEFLSFTGRNIEAGNQLNWQTASEINNAGFEVQKSANGINWEVIDWVEGKGTTTEVTSYELLDRLPFIGDNYYRLKQIDFDGKYEFSEVINIKRLAGDVNIQVQPNPSDGDFTVTVENPNKEEMNITLYDSVGRAVWISEKIRDIDLWKKDFSLAQEQLYFLNMQIGDKNYTEKILIIDRK